MRQLARILAGGGTAELVAGAGLVVAVVCLFAPGISTPGGQAGAGVGAFLAVGGAIADAWTRAAEAAAAGVATAARIHAKGAADAERAANAAGGLMASLGPMLVPPGPRERPPATPAPVAPEGP